MIRRRWLWRLIVLLTLTAFAVASGAVYIHAHPLVFNESFWDHAHCMKAGTLELINYANKHQDKFPVHPGGYGDALLLVDENCFYGLTSPGYDEAPLLKAKQEGSHLSEEECGRVYIQGLTTNPPSGSSKTAILFDKLPTPGGDHCHFLARLSAPLGREVGFVDGHMDFVPEDDWSAFAQQQINLLTQDGIERVEAERLYSSTAASK
jgi:hypothetical protein